MIRMHHSANFKTACWSRLRKQCTYCLPDHQPRWPAPQPPQAPLAAPVGPEAEAPLATGAAPDATGTVELEVVALPVEAAAAPEPEPAWTLDEAPDEAPSATVIVALPELK